MSEHYDVSNLEHEYLQLRRHIYKRFFQHVFFLFIILSIHEFLRALVFEKFSILFEAVTCLACGVLFMRFVMSLKGNQETVLTLFWMGSFVMSMIAHYHGDSGYFNQPEDTFYFGYINALLEGLIVARIPRFSYRTVFSIYSAIVRAIVIPPKDKSLLFVQLCATAFTIAIDIDKERNDKKLFTFYFNYKEQLVKFKNLVAEDIPEGISIVSKDIKQCFFTNQYFKKLVEDRKGLTITDQLNQFIFYENFDSSKNPFKSQNLTPIDNMKTLSEYLVKIGQGDWEKVSPQSLIYRRIMEPSQQNYQKTCDYLFELKTVQLMWENQPAIAVILIDVTEQHTILNLKIADLEKDKILATVSHELRTPLNSILGMVQIMMKRINDQELLHFLDICKSSGNLLLGLVNSILDLHQIRAKKLKLNPEKIELKQFLKDILHLFEYQSIQKRLDLKLKISSTLLTTIVTDKNRLSQIFINLLGNALKFTENGGITLEAKSSSNREDIEFIVEDTGYGIKEEEKHKLFQMFGKLEQENENVNRQGVGLGLLISDNLARLLYGNSINGGIKLESEYGKGSKFTFFVKKDISIPKERILLLSASSSTAITQTFSRNLHLDTDDCEYGDVDSRIQNYSSHFGNKVNVFERLNTSFPCSESKRRFKQFTKKPQQKNLSFYLPKGDTDDPDLLTPTILIVDDNPLNIVVAEHLIRSHNFKVKSALSGHAAINIVTNYDASKDYIKLILMDCQMPKMDGLHTTRVLKRLFVEKKIKNIPIVALTANDSKEDIEACRVVGMVQHLSKPLKDKDLAIILNKYCKEL